MFKLGYSTNGISNIDLFDAIKEVEKVGYKGIELCFHKEQFNPFSLTEKDLKKLKDFFDKTEIKPVSIGTGTTFFLSNTMPHGPSIFDINPLERRKRIDLIKKGIEIANKLDIPNVSFTSGFLSDEYTNNPSIDPKDILIDSIKECLIDIGQVTLVIEPEPGMLIENLEDGINIVSAVNSPSFKLHLDIGHAYFVGENYIQDIEHALPYTKYVHLADIKSGYNINFLNFTSINDNFKSSLILGDDDFGYLIYFEKEKTFILIDNRNIVYFYYGTVSASENNILTNLKNLFQFSEISKVNLQEILKIKVTTDEEREIKAYIDSVPKMTNDFLKLFIPILRFLRTTKDKSDRLFIDKPMGYTIRGKVHYHEFPGKGEIDFHAVFSVLIKNNYEGPVTVELYNHLDIWQKVIPDSFNYLKNIIDEVMDGNIR